jgi:maltose O-acetyltransferase
MSDEFKKMVSGEMYDPEDVHLTAIRQKAARLCRKLSSLDLDDSSKKVVLKELLGEGGDTVRLQGPFFCDYGINILLGENVFFNFNCVILDVCEVRIGDYTLLGPSVQIYTAMHPMNHQERRKLEYGKPVSIGADVWIGGGAIVCPGVSIGGRSVIGAGSVVTRDIPEGVFAAGNPCRVIKRLEDDPK